MNALKLILLLVIFPLLLATLGAVRDQPPLPGTPERHTTVSARRSYVPGHFCDGLSMAGQHRED